MRNWHILGDSDEFSLARLFFSRERVQGKLKNKVGAMKAVQDSTERHRDRRIDGLQGLDLDLMATENPMKALRKDAGFPKLCINIDLSVERETLSAESGNCGKGKARFQRY